MPMIYYYSELVAALSVLVALSVGALGVWLWDKAWPSIGARMPRRANRSAEARGA
jgi:hypothetical protein